MRFSRTMTWSRPQAVKVVATVCAVLGQEDVYDEVSHVKDRAVDIKDDAELILRRMSTYWRASSPIQSDCEGSL